MTRIGQRATWSSQARGTELRKSGVCVAVVPPGEHPPRKGLRDPGAPRDHESYVLEVDGRRYWPVVAKLSWEDDAAYPGAISSET